MSDILLDNLIEELVNYNRDDKSTKDEKYARQLVAIHDEFVKRNEKLTKLLDDYISQHNVRAEENHKLKRFIFGFFVFILTILTFIISFVFLKIDYSNVDLSSVAALISVAVTYIGSILSILKIMSKYLFPIEEEKDTISMIKTVIENDIEIEKIMPSSVRDSIKNSSKEKIELIFECKKLLDVNGISEEEYNKIKKEVLGEILE